MVICQLANYAPPFYGNFMASLLDLENKVITNNTNNMFIYVFYQNSKECNWIKEMQQKNKNIFFLKNKYFKGFLQLKKVIQEYNINILHSHFTIPVIMFFFIKIFYPKILIISHFHNLLSGIYGASVYKKRIFSKIKLHLYNKKIIDMFCGCGEAVFNDLIKCGINKEKCCYIDNGIDFSRLDKMQSENKYNNIIKNKNVLMIYGSFFFTKGVDITLKAISDIAEKLNIILLIVCQNKESVLKDINITLNYIPDWILIVPSQENIAEYFKMSCVYLIPSREEGFPYTMLESIYCETPVIRSNIPSMDRKLPNDFVVPVNDIEALRQCIESVLKISEIERKIIVSEQKKYIVKKWNIDIWGNNIINMYINAINEKGKITCKQ